MTMRGKRSLLAAAGAAVIALAGPLAFSGPAAAEPYGTRTCTTAPLVSCTTGSLEPHSSEGWLEVRFSGGACRVSWSLYNVSNNWQRVAGGTKYFAASTTFKVHGLVPGHYYRLEAVSQNCVLGMRLRNFT
ncbi:hypothetical protein PS9374_06417 [Planomonospora sphaerica]|uniref:Secreted protein n=3 Tax=Planomonospora TaxID=1998 RepID=A0A171DNU8_9ACTN|nr:MULTISPECIES: hypothetical protein [Planomonospora]GAT70731.1 hypothetical protein PS9374_06417 [Planomonospora sphaerica]GGK52228.1 hypothetical protein GCM10010126_09670 [Planomonospora parontospora]GII06895.1 hypothetical protein Ppa06_06930 [Planomonospora parontospora subsp. parontospora]